MKSNVCISFYMRSGTVRIHRSTLKCIADPVFVRFLVSDDKKVFAVQSYEKKDFRSFRIYQNQANKTDKVEIYSKGLCNSLSRIAGWASIGSYRVYGKVFPAQGVAVFDLTSYEVISELSKGT
ncbi:hypothetical protein SDC9_185954 [bioreactor metagenome]|uniref:Uncharacterized protein n=1 Tax=bioreactor metagenome TaxID=1076179 RepID=A0A645HI64_9ZZZZ